MSKWAILFLALFMCHCASTPKPVAKAKKGPPKGAVVGKGPMKPGAPMKAPGAAKPAAAAPGAPALAAPAAPMQPAPATKPVAAPKAPAAVAPAPAIEAPAEEAPAEEPAAEEEDEEDDHFNRIKKYYKKK